MVAPSKRVRHTLRKQKAKVIKDATLLKGIKQGVGMVVKKPYGSGKLRPKKSVVRSRISRRSALCALTNSHLALPRAVGAYTVTKTTTIINSDTEVMLFGCVKGDRSNHHESTWYNVAAISNAPGGSESQIGATDNARFYINSALSGSGFNAARLVPAAITVQVMCPTNLQSADGITYIGRSKQVLELAGDTRTWTALAEELVSFSAPRLCSAGKLALRGVKIDAVPYNMSQLSDFAPRGVLNAPADKTWGGNLDANFEGFAPIFCYNKNAVTLQYLVTIEWRTRFDPNNPAYAGHTFHPVATDSCWNDTIKGMETEGHGVVDMADGIVDFGDAAMSAVGAVL